MSMGVGPTGKPSRISGTGFRNLQTQSFTQPQMELFGRLFSNVSPESFLSKISQGDEGAFQQAEAPGWRALGEAQGMLGSRYSQMAPGAMSAQGGSGFQNAQNSLSQNFAESLQSRRMGLQSQALRDLMGMSESLLGQRPYETDYLQEREKKDSFLKQLVLGLAGGGAQGLGSFGGMGIAKKLGVF